MDEYIKRSAAIGELHQIARFMPSQSGTVCDCIAAVRSVPADDVVEVVHASWNEDGRCSHCDWYMPFDCEGNGVESEYCPVCGAKMDEKRRDQKECSD